MSIISLVVFLFTSLTLQAATWKAPYRNLPGAEITTAVTACPVGYIGVPPLVPYTYRYFCVAKYEMRQDADGMTATSIYNGNIWVGITQAQSIIACRNLGSKYDLISNDQWQTIARNIAGVASNWSGGAVGNGQLNNGHTDNDPPIRINAVVDDNDPCNGTNTGSACSSTVWNVARRTHKLSNNNVIWDFAGNVSEWLVNDNTFSYPTDTYVSQMTQGSRIQTAFGARLDTICATPAVSPYCGMGKGMFTGGNNGNLSRGGSYSIGVDSGIFTLDSRDNNSTPWPDTGFRCVYNP